MNVANWREIYDMSLEEAAVARLLLWSVAANCRGKLGDSELERFLLPSLPSSLDPSELRHVLDGMSMTPREAQRRQQEVTGQGRGATQYRRFLYNPLVERPVVALSEQERVAPVPLLIARSINATRVYFDAADQWGEPFRNQFGHRFEAWVGRHLKLITGAAVHSEVTYSTSRVRRSRLTGSSSRTT
ncbi:hypothetical protein [Georgenia muralis]